MTGHITESRFYMWRALFAIAHADENVCNQERDFMHKAMQEHPFSEEQRLRLEEDMRVGQDVVALFAQIDDPQDRSLFFDYARKLVWCDGDYGEKEQEILLKLGRAHVLSADLDSLATPVALELDEGSEHPVAGKQQGEPAGTGFFTWLFSGFDHQKKSGKYQGNRRKP